MECCVHKSTRPILLWKLQKYSLSVSDIYFYSDFCFQMLTVCIVRTPKEDQPLRLLLSLLFYQFNRSEPLINPSA